MKIENEKIIKVGVNQLKSCLDIITKKIDNNPVYEKMGLLIYGSYGIGKSKIIKQYCQKNDIDYCYVNLFAKDSFDLNGLPTMSKEDNQKVVFARPSEYPDENSKKKTMIVFDECTRVSDKSVHQTLMNLITTNYIADHKMPDETYYVLISNLGEEDGTNIIDIDDKAFISRLLRVQLKNSVSQWISHHKKILPENYLNFVKENKSQIENNEVVPRDLNQVYTYAINDMIDVDLSNRFIMTKFGDKKDIVKIFKDFIEKETCVSFDDIINNRHVSSKKYNQVIVDKSITELISDKEDILNNHFSNVVKFLSADNRNEMNNIIKIYKKTVSSKNEKNMVELEKLLPKNKILSIKKILKNEDENNKECAAVEILTGNRYHEGLDSLKEIITDGMMPDSKAKNLIDSSFKEAKRS